MQKKIIALAIAGLASTAAFAQTNVTVYGIADLGEAYVAVHGNNTSKQSVTRLDSNSSYIGFKGVEDLGNGLKAVFQFETGVNGDVGGFGAGRDTYVGLAGGFGTVVAGNITHPLRAFANKVDIMPGQAGIGTIHSVVGKIYGIKTGADERAANTVAYVSPSFGGVTLVGAFINSPYCFTTSSTGGAACSSATVETRTASANPRAYQLAAQFDNGPLFAGIGYHRVIDLGTNLAGTLGASEENAAVIRAAVSYTLPSNTRLAAMWDNTKVDIIGSAGSANRNAYALAVAQGFGKNTVGLQYALSTSVKAAGDKVKDTKSSIVSAVYTYDLSKRTSLHARVSYLNDEKNIAGDFYNNTVTTNVANSSAAGADYTGAMVGLRHAF
jgi:predicted porin